MAENVLEIIFRARNADQVARATEELTAALRELGPAAAEGSQGVERLEETTGRVTQAISQAAEQGGPIPLGVTVPEGLQQEVAKLREELDKLRGAAEAAGKGTEEAARRSRGLGGQLGPAATAAKDLGGALTGLALRAAATVGGFLAIERTVRSVIRAASEAEQAQTQLAFSFQAVGRFSGAAVQEMQRFATAQSAVTRFSDEQVQSTAALIQQVGRLSGPALQQATQAALDLATGLGRTTDAMALLIARAAQGETEGFGRLGIVIDQTLPKSQRFQAALEGINRSFGGASQASVRTYAGAVDQLRNTMGELGETIGGVVLPRLAQLARSLTGSVQAFLGLGTSGSRATRDLVRDLEALAVAAEKNSGTAARIFRERFANLEQEIVTQFRIEVLRGDLDETLRTLAFLDEVVKSSGAAASQEFLRVIEQMRAIAAEGIPVKVAVQATQAATALQDAIRQLRGAETLDVLVKGTPDFQQALRDFQAFKATVEQPVLIQADRSRLQDLQAELATVEEQLLALRDAGEVGIELGTTLARAEELRREIAAVQAQLDVLSRSGLLQQTVALRINRAQTEEELAEILRILEEQFKEASDKAVVDVSLVASADSLLATLAQARQLVEQRRVQIKLPDIEANVRLQTETAQAALDRLAATVRSLQEQAGAPSAVILDTQALLASGQAGEQALDRLGAALDAVAARREPAELVAAYDQLGQVLLAVGQSALVLDVTLGATLAAQRQRLLDLLRELGPLEQARSLRIEAEAHIELGQLQLARQLLEDIKKLAAETHDVKIQLEVQRLEKDLKGAEDAAGVGASKIAEVFRTKLEGATTDVLVAGFRQTLGLMEQDAQNFSGKIQSIFSNMVDALIAKLSELAVAGFFKAIGRLIGTIVPGEVKVPRTGSAGIPATPPPLQPGEKGKAGVDTRALDLELRSLGRGLGQLRSQLRAVSVTRFSRAEPDEPSRVQASTRALSLEVRGLGRSLTQLRSQVRLVAPGLGSDLVTQFIARGITSERRLGPVSIRALDSADFERYMRDKGQRAIDALTLAGR